MRPSVKSLAAGGILLLASAAARSDDWPQFRGPTGLSTTSEKNLPLRWGGEKAENVAWKSLLVGEGHASPIVSGGRVFVCTVRWPGGKPDASVIPEHHVLGYRAADGKLLWDTPVDPGPWRRDDFRGGVGGSYAAPTPATDGKHVFVVFGSSVMASLTFDGKLAWRQEIKPYSFDCAIGTSPVLFEDTILLLCEMANPADSRLVAFAKSDGRTKWETKLPGIGIGHSTPILIDIKGRLQLVLTGTGTGDFGEALQSFDPANGRRLWWCKAPSYVASLAYGSGILYADRNGTGVAVDPTGEGDVSATHIKWTVGGLSDNNSSPIIVGGHIFRLQDSGIVKIRKVSDGQETDKQRFEKLGSSWASPIADGDGRIYFANGGKSTVIQAGPQLKVLAVNDLGDPNHASPAISNGRIFIAGLKYLYCIETRHPGDKAITAGSDAGAPGKAPPITAPWPPDLSIDGVTLCWFDGKLKWGKVGTLQDGVETPWFNGAAPPESTNAADSPFKYRRENIPGGSIHQWDAYASRGDFPIKAGDKLFVYVFLDPGDPPKEVLLQLRANGSYDHRAFWGTVNRVTHMEPPRAGDLPAPGTWIRIEVDPSMLGLGAKTKR
jgi:outer membrane protein assembly factor BamB